MSDQKPHPLPVVAIIRDAIVIPWRKREVMFRTLLPISLVLIALDTISQSHFSKPHPVHISDLGPAIVLVVLTMLAFTVFAVICHRLILLGDESVPKYGLTTWSTRETRFVGWTLFGMACIMAIGAAVLIPFGALVILSQQVPSKWETLVAVCLILVPCEYVLARLWILFPATAVDERRNIKWACDVTENNGWRLVLVVGVLPLILGQGPRYLLGHSVIVDLLVHVVECVLYVVEIAALSLSYQHLTGRYVHDAGASVGTAVGEN